MWNEVVPIAPAAVGVVSRSLSYGGRCRIAIGVVSRSWGRLALRSGEPPGPERRILIVSVAVLEVVVRSNRDDASRLPVKRRPLASVPDVEPALVVVRGPSDGSSDAPSDTELVNHLLERRVDAIDALYRKYGKACYRLARRVVVDASLAEDCVQEAFPCCPSPITRPWTSSVGRPRTSVGRQP
jgi:hypothetical protein